MPIENNHRRIVMCVKDVENITGRKNRAARQMLYDIRKKFEMHKNELVTIREFSMYTGIDEELLFELMRD